MKHQTGFTILELSVVLALMALMAGVVTVSMNGRLRAAHEDQVLAAVRALDHTARHEARTTPGGVAITFDTQANRVTVETQRDRGRVLVEDYAFPSGLSLNGVWVLRNGRRVERKALTIPMGPGGSSPTYGFTVFGEDEDGYPTTSSVLVAGVSGQFMVLDDEKDVQDILESIAGHDAD